MTRGPGQSDEVLMALVQGGDARAFATLYDRHQDLAHRVVAGVCRDGARAEDAVQEGFLSVWCCRAQYRLELGSFRVWSMQVVRHRAIDLVRRAAAHPTYELDERNEVRPDRTASDQPHDRAIAQGEKVTMLGLLAQLPKDQAEVIVLAYFAELSQPEIATFLALPLGTVKSRMRLALEKLRGGMAVLAQ